jgi:hypothetical protein
MPLVATDAMLHRRTNSAGTLFSPVATGAPIKWGSNRHIAPQDRRNHVRLSPVINHTPAAVEITVPAHQSWRWCKSALRGTDNEQKSGCHIYELPVNRARSNFPRPAAWFRLLTFL